LVRGRRAEALIRRGATGRVESLVVIFPRVAHSGGIVAGGRFVAGRLGGIACGDSWLIRGLAPLPLAKFPALPGELVQ